jgi:hypothetical protein
LTPKFSDILTEILSPHIPDEFSVAGADKARVLGRLVVEGRAVVVQRVVRVQNVIPALASAQAQTNVQKLHDDTQ